MPIYLHVICGCFPAARAELSRCERDHEIHKAKSIYYLYVALYRKWFLIPSTLLGTMQTELYNLLHP